MAVETARCVNSCPRGGVGGANAMLLYLFGLPAAGKNYVGRVLDDVGIGYHLTQFEELKRPG